MHMHTPHARKGQQERQERAPETGTASKYMRGNRKGTSKTLAVRNMHTEPILVYTCILVVQTRLILEQECVHALKAHGTGAAARETLQRDRPARHTSPALLACGNAGHFRAKQLSQ